MKTIEHFVGGKSFSGESKRISKVFNPATGEQMHKDADRVAKVTIAKALKDVINA